MRKLLAFSYLVTCALHAASAQKRTISQRSTIALCDSSNGNGKGGSIALNKRVQSYIRFFMFSCKVCVMEIKDTMIYIP